MSKNGLIIISLPDCNEGIEKGEISMTMHQHLNYFDKEGLKNTVEAAGLEVLTIDIAKYGGSLYCCARNLPENKYVNKSGKVKFEQFNEIIDRNIQKVIDEIKPVLEDSSKTVGFYVPLRTLPYISILGKYDGFRFFDDTHHWYQRAFDGVEVYIENFNDLKNNPVTDLYIMSLTFGDVIKNKVANEIPEIKNIKVLREIFDKR